MADNVRVEFVSVNRLAEDGITCTDGYLALRISTDGILSDVTAFETPEEAKEALFDDIDEIISTHCSQDEMDTINAVLNARGGFYFYDKFIKTTDVKVNEFIERVPLIQALAHGECREQAIKEFITEANESFGDNGKIKLQEALEEIGVEVRICSECGKLMATGYCIGEGDAYYCEDECLENNMTREQFNELYDDGNGDSYHTDWWE